MTKTSVDARGVPATLSLFPSFPRLSHQTSAIGTSLPIPLHNKNAYVLSTSPSFFLRPAAVHLPSKTTSFRSGTLTSLLRLLDLRAPFLHPSTNFYLFFFSSRRTIQVRLGWGQRTKKSKEKLAAHFIDPYTNRVDNVDHRRAPPFSQTAILGESIDSFVSKVGCLRDPN